MAGTRAGGLRAAQKLKEKDPEFYRRIGSKGGSTEKKSPAGFAADRKLASRAGRKGGTISRRNKNNGS